jgi:polysaccharide chain length determinant protein (PEP-CTERM system associated)
MLGHRQFSLDDYFAILRRRLWLLIIPTILGAIVAYLISLALPNRYTSQTVVLIEQQTVPQNYVQSVVTEGLDQRLATMQAQILSASRLEPIIRRLGLFAKDVDGVSMETLVDRLRKAIEVTAVSPMPQTNSNVLPGFVVRVTESDPRVAQQICAEVTSLFMQENLRFREERSEDTTEFLSKQLDEAKVKLDEQDSKLAAFKGHYLGDLPENEQTNLSILMGLNSQLEATAQSLIRAQQDKAFTESMLSQQVTAWQALQTGQHPVVTLERQLADLQDQLVTLQARYTDDHPDVIKMKNDIAQLTKKIAEANQRKLAEARQRKVTEAEEETASEPDEKKEQVSIAEPPEIQQLRMQLRTLSLAIREETAQEKKLEQQIQVYQGRVQLSPAVEQQYKQVTRDYQTALDFYNDLLRKRSQSAMATELERRQQGEQFRVLDAASLPQEPSFPNRPFITLQGLGVGLALGIGLALGLEWIDTTIRTEGDVEALLKVPTLALVPSVELQKLRKSGSWRGAKSASFQNQLSVRS